jgi:hypothetical protein
VEDDPNVGKSIDGSAPRPQPLNYAQAEGSRAVGHAIAAIPGALASIFFVGFIGAVEFPYPIHRPTTRPSAAWSGVGVFLAIAAGGIVGTALLWLRRPLERPGWFFMGILIGLAIVGLLEGACYANP